MFALKSPSECRCQSTLEGKRLGHPSDLSSILIRERRGKNRTRWIFLRRVEDEEVKKGEQVGVGHHEGDDHVNPRGLSHPIPSFIEQRGAKDWKMV